MSFLSLSLFLSLSKYKRNLAFYLLVKEYNFRLKDRNNTECVFNLFKVWSLKYYKIKLKQLTWTMLAMSSHWYVTMTMSTKKGIYSFMLGLNLPINSLNAVFNPATHFCKLHFWFLLFQIGHLYYYKHKSSIWERFVSTKRAHKCLGGVFWCCLLHITTKKKKEKRIQFKLKILYRKGPQQFSLSFLLCYNSLFWGIHIQYLMY